MRTPDHFYSVARCQSGLGASKALATTSGETRHWEKMIRYWEAQLQLAQKRETADAH